MKIGIITFQFAWNCGAVLQCYALKKYLENDDNQVVVINYCPKYKEYRYKKYGNPFINAKMAFKSGGIKRSCKKFLRTLLNYRKESEHIRQWKGFRDFTHRFLNLTKEYSSLDSLQSNPPDCDVYISGSDQLWNPNLTNNDLDEVYFLNFGNPNIKKLTYAVNACELDLDVYGKRVKQLCSPLNYISLREKDNMIALEQIIGKKIEVCPDPTFLIEVEEYEAILKKENDTFTDYILVYALEDGTDNNSLLFERVKKLQSNYNKKIIVISGPHRWPYKVEQIRGITPSEFLSYIKNAFCVICNSFHATVFSILYEKKFVTYGFKNRNTRVKELLNILGLSDRSISNDEEIVSKMEHIIHYNDVREKINNLKLIGKEYLKNALK